MLKYKLLKKTLSFAMVSPKSKGKVEVSFQGWVAKFLETTKKHKPTKRQKQKLEFDVAFLIAGEYLYYNSSAEHLENAVLPTRKGVEYVEKKQDTFFNYLIGFIFGLVSSVVLTTLGALISHLL